MTVHPDHLRHARQVADAILYEGYLLYPYRRSACKNQLRFQFGVLMPPAYATVDDSEPSASQTECLLECRDDAQIEIHVRFLQVQRRTERRPVPDARVALDERAPTDARAGLAAGETALPAGETAPPAGETAIPAGEDADRWDEARDRELRVGVSVASLLRQAGDSSGRDESGDSGGADESVRVGAVVYDGRAGEPHRDLGPGESRHDIEPGQEVADATDAAGGPPAGRVIREWGGLRTVIGVHAERVAGPYGALRLRVRVANQTAPPEPVRCRQDGLRYALISAHSLIAVSDGQFISMTDPPEWAASEVAACTNTGTWPVLAGPPGCKNLMLSSPVILADHPEVAPESAGELFDSTEIDEILTLRTLALTDAERGEARATDPRAAELLDRLDDLPPEMLERMHGAIRYLAPARNAAAGALSDAQRAGAVSGDLSTTGAVSGAPGTTGARAGGASTTGALSGDVRLAVRQPADAAGDGVPGWDSSTPWWDPAADTSVSPDTDQVVIAGHRVARGSRVTMRPGTRRADAQDLFLAGREAVVEAVVHDVDGNVHVAVRPADDPVAALQGTHGRFLYFAPDEIEPLSDAAGGTVRSSGHSAGDPRVARVPDHDPDSQEKRA